MKLKQRTGDFRVLEVLNDNIPQGGGEHRVYRVTKSKLTTIEAAEILAKEAGVEKRCVQFAGLKDRQGVTVQYISVEGGKRLQITQPGLKVEHVFDSKEPIESGWVKGNAFDITVRDLNREDVRCFREAREAVTDIGVPNYFDDQRFGSLRHGQGFVVKEMINGEIESALKRCLLFPSPFDPPHDAAFKGRLRRAWGEWEQCVRLCRGGKHISVFEHLVTHPTDFGGAFRYISTRIRLIHLYTYQSYLWNESVSEYLQKRITKGNQLRLLTDAGSVTAYREVDPTERARLLLKTFPLLAPDVKITDPDIRAAVSRVLERENLTLAKLKVPGVEGFAFKAEERPLVVVPKHMRAMKPEDDELAHGFSKIRLRFELPRGSYATMVVKRLFVTSELEQTREPLRVGGPAPNVEFTKKPRSTRVSQIREFGDIPASIRGELKFTPKPKWESKDERDSDGKLAFKPRPAPEQDDRDLRDADGKLTFKPKPAGAPAPADRAPSTGRGFEKRPPGWTFKDKFKKNGPRPPFNSKFKKGPRSEE